MKTVLSICLLLSGISVVGQNAITGKVVDSGTGDPLVGAAIYLLSNLSCGTVSDKEGNFTLSTQQANSLDSILISYMGYEEQVLLLEDFPSVILMPGKDQLLAPFEVIAEPLIAEEFEVVRINKIGIYTQPSAKGDALLAVNALPASTTTDESAAVSLRGSSPAETGIFLNGVPVYDAVRFTRLNGVGTLSLFNTALIRDVSVFPGNPPLEFGNTSSGVVSLQTDEGSIERNSNQLLLSPANLGFHRHQKWRNLSINVFSNFQPSALLKWMNPGSLSDISSFGSRDAGLYLRGTMGEAVSIRSYSYVGREFYRYEFRHPSFQGLFYQDNYRMMNVTNLAYQAAQWMISWNQGYFSSHTDYAFSASDFGLIKKSFFQGVNFSRTGEKLHLKFGGSWDYLSSLSQGNFFLYAYALARDHPISHYRNKNARSLFDAFGYVKYYLSEKWIAGLGLRGNLDAPDRKRKLSKQINITYLRNSDFKLIASAGEYHRYILDESEGRSIALNSKQSSVDVIYTSRKANISLSGFLKWNEAEGLSTNIRGGEASVNSRFSDRWNANVAYTLISSSRDSGRNQYFTGYFLKGGLCFQPSPLWTLSTNSIYRQGILYDEVGGATLIDSLHVYQPGYEEGTSRYPNYFIVNFSANRIFSFGEACSMVAYITVNNLADRKNIRAFTYNFDYTEKIPEFFSRRLIYAGVQLNF